MEHKYDSLSNEEIQQEIAKALNWERNTMKGIPEEWWKEQDGTYHPELPKWATSVLD